MQKRDKLETLHRPAANAHVGQGTPYMKYAAPPYPTPRRLLPVMWVLKPGMIENGHWKLNGLVCVLLRDEFLAEGGKFHNSDLR